MKRLFSSSNAAEVGLLKNILQKAGISCFEKNEQIATTIPTLPFQPELWVEDERFDDAASLMAEWHNPTASGAPWVCSRCGEKLEPQFTKCWKCGTRRDAAA